LKVGMATISFDLSIFGTKYFAVLFYEWDSFDIQKILFCMGEPIKKYNNTFYAFLHLLVSRL